MVLRAASLMLAFLLASPAAAQEQFALFEGAVTFEVDAGAEYSVDDRGYHRVEFWRPLVFERRPLIGSKRKVAGRMDCTLLAREREFAPELFQPRESFERLEERRRAAGFITDRIDTDYGDTIRKLVVSSHRTEPSHADMVLVVWTARDGERLFDVAYSCTITHNPVIAKTDFAELVERHVRLTLVPMDAQETDAQTY